MFCTTGTRHFMPRRPAGTYKLPPLLDRKFKLGAVLGEGGFAKVYDLREKSNDARFALKVVHYTAATMDKKEGAMKEIEIMKSLRHDHIIRFYESVEDKRYENISLVLELAPQGDLLQFMKQYSYPKKLISERQIWVFMYQLSAAVSYLHNATGEFDHPPTLHRDIKLGNILIDKDGFLKLSDFGLSKQMIAITETSSGHGTPEYAAPEIFEGVPYGPSVDIWSLACVLYNLATACMAFSNSLVGAFDAATYEKPVFPDTYSREMHSLGDRMFSLDPAERPTSSDLLAYHPIALGGYEVDLMKRRIALTLQEAEVKETLERAKLEADRIIRCARKRKAEDDFEDDVLELRKRPKVEREAIKVFRAAKGLALGAVQGVFDFAAEYLECDG